MFRKDRAPFWVTLFPATFLFLALYAITDSRMESAALTAGRAPVEDLPYVDGDEAFAGDPREAEVAIVEGLGWLERHQFPDGMWSGRSFMLACPGAVCLDKGGEMLDVAITALCVLAILESPHAMAKNERESAERGLRWLLSRQDGEGCFGPREGKFVYGHALATLAFCRAVSVLGDPVDKVHARRGIRFLETARNPDLGWRYGVRTGENDTNVTVWAGAALAAAMAIDIEVDPATLEGLHRWLDRMTGPEGDVSYRTYGAGGSAIEGRNDHFEPNATLAALAAAVRFRLGAKVEDAPLQGARTALACNLPVWRRRSVDFLYWYAGAQALVLLESPEGSTRKSWASRVRFHLSQHQRRDGCSRGSWNPVDKWGCEGGRVYATAVNVLTLSLARAQ